MAGQRQFASAECDRCVLFCEWPHQAQANVRKSEFKVGSYSQLEGPFARSLCTMRCCSAALGRSVAAAAVAAGAVNFLRHCISRPDEQLNWLTDSRRSLSLSSACTIHICNVHIAMCLFCAIWLAAAARARPPGCFLCSLCKLRDASK